MNDIARERDTFATQNEELRRQVVQAESETEAVRNSVFVSFVIFSPCRFVKYLFSPLFNRLQVETRLQEERQGKERAKAELEARLEDVNRRKSKCTPPFPFPSSSINADRFLVSQMPASESIVVRCLSQRIP